MNIKYLMQHISYNLHTFVRQFDKSYNEIYSFCAINDFEDIIITKPNTKKELLSSFENITPQITCINNSLNYALVDTDDFFYLIGPVRFSMPITLLHNLDFKKIDSDWIDTISCVNINDFSNNIILLHNLLHEITLDYYTFIHINYFSSNVQDEIQQHFSDILFNTYEFSKKHNPYDQEVREFSSIRNGDIEQLKKSWSEDYVGTIGTLAKDKLRNFKNLGIVLVTLASRAAIDGGMIPELAYSLCDSYICKIEESTTPETASHLGREAEFQYTLAVKDIKIQKKNSVIIEQNPYINKCKDYIYSHLHEKITVCQIAKELHLNANYLSELFKKCEGISLTDYILNEKIKLAKNLLTYSPYSYIEIATYLSFSSQSHLGKQFKKTTGVTLKQYRNSQRLYT